MNNDIEEISVKVSLIMSMLHASLLHVPREVLNNILKKSDFFSESSINDYINNANSINDLADEYSNYDVFNTRHDLNAYMDELAEFAEYLLDVTFDLEDNNCDEQKVIH